MIPAVSPDPLLAVSDQEQNERRSRWFGQAFFKVGYRCQAPAQVRALLEADEWDETAHQKAPKSLFVLRGLLAVCSRNPAAAQTLLEALTDGLVPITVSGDLWSVAMYRAPLLRQLFTERSNSHEPDRLWTPLIQAILRQWPDLPFWISAKAIEPWQSPLVSALQWNDGIAEAWVKRGILDQESPESLRDRWLPFAIRRNDSRLFAWLLDHGVSAASDPDGQTLLHQLARRHSVNLFPLVGNLDLDRNALDAWGQTPAHAAAQGLMTVRWDATQQGLVPRTAAEMAEAVRKAAASLQALQAGGTDLSQIVPPPPPKPKKARAKKKGADPLPAASEELFPPLPIRAKGRRRPRNAALPGETALGSLVRREGEGDLPPGTVAAIQAALLSSSLGVFDPDPDPEDGPPPPRRRPRL